MSSIKNRRGKIIFNASTIFEELDSDNGALLQKILSNIIVMEAYYSVISNSIEYLGYSSLFDEIPNEEVAPLYKVTINILKSNEWDPPIREFSGFVRIYE